MTNEKIFANEILSDEQLANVNAGTVGEFNDIWSALEKQAGGLGKFSSGLRTVMNFLPVGRIGTAVWRNAAAPLAEKALKDVYGINSYISIGWLGTGIRDSGNTYSKDGKPLTHQEVLNIINAG